MENLPGAVAASVISQLKPLLQTEIANPAINSAVSDAKAQSVLERQINDYAELVSTDPRTAFKLLQNLQQTLESDAPSLIRFRGRG